MKNIIISPLIPELCCDNINTSLNFYLTVLGFTIHYQREEDGFAMLDHQGSQLMLCAIQADSKPWAAAPLEVPYGRGINLQIRTTDVDALYDRVNAAKATIFLPMEEKWYRAKQYELGQRQFIVLDPDGYMLRFFQDLGERHYTAQPVLE